MAFKDAVLFLAARPKIGPIAFNCNLSEVHGRDYMVAQMPIEDGSVLTEHKIGLPVQLQIEAVLSRYPDNIVDQVRGFDANNPFSWDDSSKTAWSRIKQLGDSLEPFDVVTEREVYKSMTVQSYSSPVNTLDAIVVSFSLLQVEVANVSRSKFLAENFTDIGTGPDNLGLQEATPL